MNIRRKQTIETTCDCESCKKFKNLANLPDENLRGKILELKILEATGETIWDADDNKEGYKIGNIIKIFESWLT